MLNKYFKNSNISRLQIGNLIMIILLVLQIGNMHGSMTRCSEGVSVIPWGQRQSHWWISLQEIEGRCGTNGVTVQLTMLMHQQKLLLASGASCASDAQDAQDGKWRSGCDVGSTPCPEDACGVISRPDAFWTRTPPSCASWRRLMIGCRISTTSNVLLSQLDDV